MADGVDVRLVVPESAPPPPPAAVPGAPPAATPGAPSTAVPAGPAGPHLPRTGTELLAVLLIAVVLLALGTLLVQASRARRRTT